MTNSCAALLLFCGENSRRLQHDFTDAGHGAETVCRILQWKSLVLQKHRTLIVYPETSCGD